MLMTVWQWLVYISSSSQNEQHYLKKLSVITAKGIETMHCSRSFCLKVLALAHHFSLHFTKQSHMAMPEFKSRGMYMSPKRRGTKSFCSCPTQVCDLPHVPEFITTQEEFLFSNLFYTIVWSCDCVSPNRTTEVTYATSASFLKESRLPGLSFCPFPAAQEHSTTQKSKMP